MLSRHTRLVSSALALLTVSLTQSRPAEACGGCFHPPPQPNESGSVVTDHRMALSVSTTQTVLWDQIRYQGAPSEFAWVLPVGQGAVIELARDEWLGALDAIAAPTIAAPPLPASCGGSFGGGGGGCGLSSSSDNSFGGPYGYDASANFDGGNGVEVISQEVVGPYLAVTIRSSNGEAISKWLTDNGFDIPTNIQPVLDAYTNEGFDFIALRLAPNVGVQAMQPVRVITQGADPTLPLRMVAAGIGASVGLTLYVIAEGRYETTNFPNLLIDRSTVVWDPNAHRSNYTDLFAQAITLGNGWVTESSGSVGQLSAKYQAACINAPQVAVACDPSDASTGTPDAADDAAIEAATYDAAATDDAATDDATTDDGGADAADDAVASDALDEQPNATADAGTCVKYVSACSFFTDYTVATKGMAPYDVQVTRLRTTLPASALAVDLHLGASKTQTTLSTTIQTTAYSDPTYNPCPSAPTPKEGCGCQAAGPNHALVSTSFGGLALVMLMRRRRRSRGEA